MPHSLHRTDEYPHKATTHRGEARYYKTSKTANAVALVNQRRFYDEAKADGQAYDEADAAAVEAILAKGEIDIAAVEAILDGNPRSGSMAERAVSEYEEAYPGGYDKVSDVTLFDYIGDRPGYEVLDHDGPEILFADGSEIASDGSIETDQVVAGNPGDVPLHESLAAEAAHIDYEAEVVAAAADKIDDDDIADAAEDQADAMEDAAEALTDAAEAAAETAAEVFVETGTPATEVGSTDTPEGEAVTGEVTLATPLPPDTPPIPQHWYQRPRGRNNA